MAKTNTAPAVMGAATPVAKKESKGTYTIRVQKERDGEDYLEIELKEIDEPTFIMAQQMMMRGKETECAKFLLNTLRVGGCQAVEITNNFRMLQATLYPLQEFLTPLEGELKKN